MKVIIVGAGLGGLLCSIQLRKLGHDVKILERQNGLSKAGGIIMLSGSASRILHQLDLGDAFSRICQGVTSTVRRDLKTGSIATATSLINGDKITTWAAMRPDLIAVFHELATKLGVVVQFGSKVVDVIDDHQTPRIALSSGEVLAADLVIAADGVSSQTRRSILAHFTSDLQPLEPTISDRVAYLAVYDDLDFLPRLNSGSSTEVVASPSALQFFTGAEKRYIISLYQPESSTFSMLFASTEGNASMESLWDEHGDISYVRERFSGLCHPEVEQALQKAVAFQRWQMAEMPSLPRWRSQSSRVILLGDAAHAMHPTAGHGFSSTVSDVAVLGLILQHCGNVADTIPDATTLWEQACRPRDERIKDYAHFQSLMLEGDSAAIAQKMKQPQREKEIDPSSLEGKGGMNAEFGSPEFMEWFRRYDAIAEAQMMLQSTTS